MNSLGIPLARVPLLFKDARVLEEFEGPLLVLLRNEHGEPYVRLWCDRDDQFERRLVFRVGEVDLVRFLHGKATLRSLVRGTKDGLYFVEDVSRATGSTTRIAMLSADEFPLELLPDEDSYYDRTLDPGAVTVQHGRQTREVLLTGTWEMAQLADLSRKYRQIYSFLHLLGSKGTKPDVPPARFMSYDMRGGYVRRTVFTEMEKIIGSGELPRLHAIQYSSPGFIRMDVIPETADAVTACIEDYRRKELAVETSRTELLRLLGDWQGSVLFNDARSKAADDALTKSIESIAEKLLQNIDGPRLLLLMGNAFVAGQMVVAYMWRVARLAGYVDDERASFL